MIGKSVVCLSQADKFGVGLLEGGISSIAGQVMKALQGAPGPIAFASSCGGNEGSCYYST